MTNYIWSAKNNTFFPKDMISEYIENGWDLMDAIIISDEIYSTFQVPPFGKVRSSNEVGMPCWIDIPEPTKDEIISMAEQKKSRKLVEANTIITPLQDAVDFDMATEQEKSKLTDWKKYRVLLSRIDTSTAPNIAWPSQPE